MLHNDAASLGKMLREQRGRGGDIVSSKGGEKVVKIDDEGR